MFPPDWCPLQCPIQNVPLRPLRAAQLRRLNQRIAEGYVHTRLGTRVQKAWQGGVVGTDGVWAYAIVRGVVQLLPSEAVAADVLHEETLPGEQA